MWCLSHTENECVHLAEEGGTLSASGKSYQFAPQKKVKTALFQQILPPPASILQQNINKYSDAFRRVPDSFVNIKKERIIQYNNDAMMI